MFKRKVYEQLKTWKEESDGSTAILVEGARRVGKSTVVEDFAKADSGGGVDEFVILYMCGVGGYFEHRGEWSARSIQ